MGLRTGSIHQSMPLRQRAGMRDLSHVAATYAAQQTPQPTDITASTFRKFPQRDSLRGKLMDEAPTALGQERSAHWTIAKDQRFCSACCRKITAYPVVWDYYEEYAD